ncbi:hypothetical protein K0M31_011081 [Melipona bicolor]|uniref:Uncharacterized protein n=1 Tax=Melipona bicolor TaxID=60889 RepID=A0AA40KHW8_9HYME|nr:hypothetical protein K0M31_011081 [Melipona bicolor]
MLKGNKRHKIGREEKGWEKNRKQVKNRLNLDEDALERIKEEEEGRVTGLVGRITEKIREEGRKSRREKIEESRYNEMYKNIITAELPACLREKRKKKNRALIARFRCGNEIKDGQHWRENNDKMCRICQKEKENFKHILSRYETTKGEETENITIEKYNKPKTFAKVYKL